jgi:LacI family transcriptional regulator
VKSRQTTIKDIASELNISASTVSRALNDHPYISSETKKLVIELAEKLNYTPNSFATSLRSQRSNTIGVIIPEIVHFFFSTVIAGIEEVAHDAGYTILFCQSNESYEREVLDTKALITHRVDGLLVSFSQETMNFGHFKEVEEKNIPIVFFDRMMKEMDASNVIVADYDGARQATEHLLAQGCLRIAHLPGPKDLNISEERLNGYLDVLEEHHLIPEDGYMLECGGTKEAGYKCTKKLLQLSNPPDAIFANSDMVALGAMQAVKELGLNIPDDIAIIGFSNWQFSELIEPQLSTVSQPGFEIGKAAMTQLLEELNSNDEKGQHKTIILPAELIIRASSLKSKVLAT